MKVEYVPRKINSKYRKTVTVVNALNPHGNADVEIAASNTDTHHVLYHSHFYKVFVKNRMRQQQVYFNHAVTGCPELRTFDVHNVWDFPLLFEIGADTPEIQLYEMVGVSLPYTGAPAKAVAPSASKHASTKSRGGGGRAAPSTTSGRDHFMNAPWDGPAEHARERSHYARFKWVRESRHMHGPIRGMDLEMPPGINRKYRTSSSPLSSVGGGGAP
ncbi:unnamed protein product [Ectocarpus fasciculatus]